VTDGQHPAPKDLADAFLTASRALVGVAVRSIGAAPVDVTVAQHRVLVLLASRGELTVGEIADGVGVNPSNASRFCDRLQRLELVSRDRSTQDGRVVRVSLTSVGVRLVKAVTERRRNEIETVLSRMTSSDAEGTMTALHAFNRAANELSDRDWASALW